MVRAIAQLARAMNITTVAEYVETDEIRLHVASLGVDYGQGFAIARPVPLQNTLDELPRYEEATRRQQLDTAALRAERRHPAPHRSDAGKLRSFRVDALPGRGRPGR